MLESPSAELAGGMAEVHVMLLQQASRQGGHFRSCLEIRPPRDARTWPLDLGSPVVSPGDDNLRQWRACYRAWPCVFTSTSTT
jgi:hypothetical protein